MATSASYATPNGITTVQLVPIGDIKPPFSSIPGLASKTYIQQFCDPNNNCIPAHTGPTLIVRSIAKTDGAIQQLASDTDSRSPSVVPPGGGLDNLARAQQQQQQQHVVVLQQQRDNGGAVGSLRGTAPNVGDVNYSTLTELKPLQTYQQQQQQQEYCESYDNSGQYPGYGNYAYAHADQYAAYDDQTWVTRYEAPYGDGGGEYYISAAPPNGHHDDPSSAECGAESYQQDVVATALAAAVDGSVGGGGCPEVATAAAD
jgi:hypothetical protein